METEKISLNETSAPETNQVSERKGNPSRSRNLLQGVCANSWNGGYIKPIAWKRIMAGERIDTLRLKGFLRMLTPRVPAGSKLTTTFTTYFVPNRRVWTNWDKFIAQKGGSQSSKIQREPTLNGNTTYLPYASPTAVSGGTIPITDTVFWRDCWASGYLPRFGTGAESSNAENIQIPSVSILPFRGFKAIYNDFIVHKELGDESGTVGFTENLDDTVTSAETQDIIPGSQIPSSGGSDGCYHDAKHTIRGRRRNNYFTDWRTTSTGAYTGNVPVSDLMSHTEFQKQIAEARSQSENALKNDWEIVAELRGVRKAEQGRVQKINETSVGLNYTQISQTSYNGTISDPNFASLGVNGAYSYTEFDIDVCRYEEFIEDGFLHVIVQTSADTLFETGIDRTLLNTTWDSQYRPDLKNLKQDTLIYAELGTDASVVNQAQTSFMFKRKFSEYFKLPNAIAGDLTKKGYYGYDSTISSQTAFTFWHLSAFADIGVAGESNYQTKAWLDYTDWLINKNLAVASQIGGDDNASASIPSSSTNPLTYVAGQNQIFMVAELEGVVDQPIDETIKNDFKWFGEE